jgi:hypothetical protein
MSVPDVLEPPKTLPPVLPGYRPPFNSETGRAAGKQAAANLRAERENYRKLGLDKLLKPKRPRNLLLAVQKAIVRHANASAEPNLPDCGTAHARNAKLFHDIWQGLNGHNPSARNMAKRGYKPHLAGLSPSPKVEPLPSGNCEPIPASTHPASEQAPIAPVSPTSPATPIPDEDCPF